MEAVCPFCSYGLKGNSNDVFDDIMYHLREEHYQEVIEYWLEHGDIRKDYVGERRPLSEAKRRAVKNFGVELIESKPSEVECPFCDFQPSKKYDPWEDTLIHIADEHFDDFVEWADENYWGFTLGMSELAVESVMVESVIEEE